MSDDELPGRSESARKPFRRGRRPVLVGITVVSLWAIAVGITLGQARTDLEDARADIAAAEESIRSVDVPTARAYLSSSVALADSSSDRLRRPHLWPLRVLPVAAPNLRAATVLSDAAGDTARAAAELVDIASGVLDDEGETGEGDVSVGFLFDLSGPLGRFVETLERTSAEVRQAGSPWLLTPVEEAMLTYLEAAGPALEQATEAGEILDVLPDFFGMDEPRRYLLGAGSLSELRGSAGLLGSWSLLEARDGDISIGDFEATGTIDEAQRDVAAPSPEFAERYARYGSLRQWPNANLSPDFPQAAQVMLDLWEAQGGEPLDGVILLDTVTFQRLVERRGDVEVPGFTTLTPENTLRVVGVEAYAAFDDQEERKAVLGDVAAAAFAEVFDVLEDDDVPATVTMLRDLARGGHLRIYSRDPQVQDALLSVGVAGELPVVDGEFAAVFVNNVAANKVDYFTSRTIDHHIRLLRNGSTQTTITTVFENSAPSEGYPQHVLGPWTEQTEAGDNLSFVSLYCGNTCEFDALPEGVVSSVGEAGMPVADAWIRIPAGSQRSVAYRSITTDAWRVDAGSILLDVKHLVQPTLHGSLLTVRVELPDGWSAADLVEGAMIEDGIVVWSGTSSGMVRLAYRLVPHEGRDEEPDATSGR